MRTTYEQARKDFEYLETIAPLDDQVELDSQREELMRTPTKKFAKEMYIAAIELWFREHGVKIGSEIIAQRYGVESQ